MALSAGEKLGPYEILAPLGAGGMGEVYRARDTKLKRDVALKVLPAAFASDPGRMARFQREAEVLASLNHPNIAQIYGVEERALVMELVEGEAPKGPMSFDDAWKIATQIAAALEYAHEKGVIHRDLKPANIKVTPEGTVKLLDFGLAKAFSDPAPGSASDAANSPTLTMGGTVAGVILGTAAYMSPEQARGKTADKRADIWAFGVVLFELLTGKQLFRGEDLTETLASVVKEQPDLGAAPERARKILEACLQKDPQRRLQAIGDVRYLVEEGRKTAASSQSRFRIAAAAAAALAIALGALALVHFREQPPVAQATRFQFPLPAGATVPGLLVPSAISPDGRKLAFLALEAGGIPRLWIRSLDAVESRILTGADVSPNPQPFFWSADSRFLAFLSSDHKLKKIDISGGPPQTLCDADDVAGGSWSREGVILFGGFQKPVMRVSESGGTPVPLTALDAKRQELAHLSPQFLPDGRHFVYFRFSAATPNSGFYVGSIDSQPSDPAPKPLLANQAFPGYYVPSEDSTSGHFMFYQEGTVLAQAFDPARLGLRGDPVPIAEQVGSLQAFDGFFSASANGVLAYMGGSATANSQLTWFDRQGKSLGTVGEPANINDFALSPDGRRLMVGRLGAQAGLNGNLWLYDMARGAAPARFTFDASLDGYPVWSPDGSRVIFWSMRSGSGNLYQKLTSGAKNEEFLFKSDDQKYPYSWSRDGRYLAYAVETPKSKDDIWILPMEGSQKTPFLFQGTEFNESRARFSPDGHWIAYDSDATGRLEVYVREFVLGSDGKPQPTAPHLISANGGVDPQWRADGKELFYSSLDNRILSAAISTQPVFQSNPTPLSIPKLGGVASVGITADGKRFLLAVPAGKGAAPQFTVVLNWQAGLKK